ncbi:MAG TPA: LamG-like jellyroll fold domain-containing protein, partial [Verrucomicrobiae bacterium]|nr:LamG-like jellyroll fold domain-containing protein [Verrucomicrobiae bacterium]
SASASVVGSNDAPLFQWQRNGANISGATNATFTTPALTLDDDEARYRAIITAPGGGASAATREASVSVTDLPATGYANAVKADKPIVYYRFEEAAGAASAADSSAANHNGTYNNVLLENASFNAVLGKSSGFDGSSSRLAVPALGTAENFTIEAWIKPEIYKTSQAVYTADEIIPGAATLELVDEGGMLLSLEGNDPTDMDFGDDSLFAAAEWKYIVLTYDSANSVLKAYVDAELIEEMHYDGSEPANLTAGHLGAGTDVNSFYRGLIDEFAIYTNILSADRILAHYATVTGPVISPQPQDAAIFTGNTVTFTTGIITGFDEPASYQWQRNGVNIAGATNATFTTLILTDADNGTLYRAQITTARGTLTSRAASASVTSLPANGYRDAVLADAPIVYYRFEENAGTERATDSSSSNNSGDYDGVILEQASFNAVLGRAARFDESSVLVPPLPNPSQLTIETWIKPDFFEEFNAIYTTDEWMPGSLHLQLVDDEMIALSLNAGPDANGEDQEEDAIFGGESVFAPGEWRHIAVTYNNTNSTSVLFVNGVPAGTNVFAIPAVTPDLILSHIGAWNGDERFYFGSIDEFAIFNKVLTPARIQAHYQAAAGVTAARPEIQVARNGNQLTLTWSGSGFTLEQTADLSTKTWQTVTGAAPNSATVSTASGKGFFRLRKT